MDQQNAVAKALTSKLSEGDAWPFLCRILHATP
jgi:hypothetical protein